MLLEEILESEEIIREEHPELHYQIISQRPQPRDIALIFEELKTIGAKLRDDTEIYISATKNVKNRLCP